jgi:hypothetical protein
MPGSKKADNKSGKKAGYPHEEDIQPSMTILIPKQLPALLANSEHLGAAARADTLCRWLAVLHGNRLRILHFLLGAALHTVCLHNFLLPSGYLV